MQSFYWPYKADKSNSCLLGIINSPPARVCKSDTTLPLILYRVLIKSSNKQEKSRLTPISRNPQKYNIANNQDIKIYITTKIYIFARLPCNNVCKEKYVLYSERSLLPSLNLIFTSIVAVAKYRFSLASKTMQS